MADSQRRTRRLLLFRLAAVSLGLLPLVIFELAAVVLDLGRPSRHADPFAGFSAVRPLFVLNDAGTRYEIPRSRLTHFQPESFTAVKAPNEFRIFCLGGSNVQGNPYSIETSFTTWLELSLTVADPSRHWEVVNCGGISYASYRLVPIMEELTARQPDLFIVYTGQNEFLEDRTYGHLKRLPKGIVRTHESLSRLRSYTLLRAGYDWLLTRADASGDSLRSPDAASADGRSVLTAEVEALLDYRGGLEFYHRDDAWRDGVIDHFEHNLRRMVAIAGDAGVPIVLMNPVCNLRDSPPFKAEHRAGLTAAELNRWQSLWDQARQHYASDPHEAVRLLREAVAIDDQHAGVHYDLAKCLDALRRGDEARGAYILAKELDVCPLRILDPMNAIVLDVARDTGTPLVDAREIFESLSRDRIPGSDWLVDHVHPSIRGHQVLADALADELVRLQVLGPRPTWKAERDRRFAEHLASLDTLYFAKGQQRLEGLMTWARGRVTRERTPPARPGEAK